MLKPIVAILACVLLLPATFAGELECKIFRVKINESLKLIQLEMQMGVSDDSAPRETMRQMKMSNYWQQINAYIALMGQNKCPPWSGPLIPPHDEKM